MWRPFFLSCGVYCAMLGAQCLAVDKMVLTSKENSPNRLMGINTGMVSTKNKELTPPEWAPWSLMSLGAVTVLYSLTLNKQGG